MRLLIATLLLVLPAWGGEVDPGQVTADPRCQGFIGQMCCCTNDCCWQINESEVKDLGRDKWLIRSTDEVVTGHMSKDGKYWRCACDYDKDADAWVRHQGANTRCLYVPFRGF